MDIPWWRSILFFALLALFGVALFPTSREMGLLYIENRSLGKARSYLARQFHQDPEDIANAVRYLQTLLYDGEYHRFETLSSKLLKKDPNNVALHMLRARYYESVMNMKKASLHWEWLVRFNPMDQETRDKLVTYYLLNKKYDEFCRLAEQEIHTDPLNVYLYSDLGDQYLQLGKLEKAEQTYSKMEKLFPSSPEAIQRLAEIFYLQGETEKSFSQYEKLIKKFPDNEEFALTWVDQLTKYRKKELQTYLEKYVKQFPKRSSFAIDLAAFYQKKGKTDQAIQLLENYCRQAGEEAEITKQLADLYFDSNQLEKSLEFLRKYHEKTGGDYHSHHVLGDVLVAMGQRTAGREEYRKALHLLQTSF